MRLSFRLLALAIVSALLFCFAVSAAAQQIRFEDFSDVSNLQLNGSSHQATWVSSKVLRLTDGAISPGNNPQVATTYFKGKQPVNSGFTTWFVFQMHNPTKCCAPGDGVAFIIQNSTATDGTMGASGSGLTALGAGNGGTGGGMGYAGINNSLAVEFDILANPWDPNSNHVAVQTCGTGFNTPVHVSGDFTIGNNNHVESCLLFQSQKSINSNLPAPLAGLCPGFQVCQNGPVNTVVIEYDPPTGNQSTGTLSIWLNPELIPGTHTPKPGAPTIVPPIAYTIDDPSYGLSLDLGRAWVGFTADQPNQGTVQDILGWEFTPHLATLVTKKIADGGKPTMFPFGGHETDVTYPCNGSNCFKNCNPDCFSMTVEATPWDQTKFFKDRLLNTQFSNEACVTYLQTGGQCIVYSVTCLKNGLPSTCPQEPLCSPPNDVNDCIDIKGKFTTTDPVTTTNADFLKADPIGSNNWLSICYPSGACYDPNNYDGVVSGKGSGFSDLVATFQRNKP